jgi:NADPH:quinone reductase-like Zn-dependent oxidoreductase
MLRLPAGGVRVCPRCDGGISGSAPQGGWDARICSEAVRRACLGAGPARAEYTAVDPAAVMEPLAKIPDAVTDDQAAALPTAERD